MICSSDISPCSEPLLWDRRFNRVKLPVTNTVQSSGLFCYSFLLAVDLPPRPVLSFRWRTAPLTCYTPIRASAGRSPRRPGAFASQIVTRTVRAHRTVTRTKCRGTICIFRSQIQNVADIWNDCRSCEPSTQNSTSALPQLSARSAFWSCGIWSYLLKLSWIRIQK